MLLSLLNFYLCAQQGQLGGTSSRASPEFVSMLLSRDSPVFVSMLLSLLNFYLCA